MIYVTLLPAYGKDYKSTKEARAAWDAGADFVIQCVAHPFDGKLMSKRDAEPGYQYSIRYRKKTQICEVKS